MNLKNELVIIVGASIFQLRAIDEAKKMGFRVLAFDMNPHAVGVAHADFFEQVSTKDIDACVAHARRYAKQYAIRGVFTAGTDVSYTVACIGEALSLPGNKPNVALRATDKFLMRSRLAECNVPCPRFFKAQTVDEALEQAEQIGFPLVIKPVDNMGARGVRRIDSADELREQFDISVKFSGHFSQPAVIIEEYMPGDEISMDTLVYKNTVHLLTIADRHITFPPYFVEIGHSIPSLLSSEKLENAFFVMQQAVAAIGIENGAAKADIKITPEGAKIGEITARLSGGFHSQYTEKLATGMNSTKAALDIAVGNELDYADITPKYTRVAIERALLPEAGKVIRIEGIEEARNLEGIYDVFLTASVNDCLEPLRSNIGKAGHVIAFGDTLEEAEAHVERAKNHIVIATEPLQSLT